MASVPGKAEKWFSETRKHLKHSFKGRHVKNVKYEEGMEVHACNYCPKAFSDTRCLVMHTLRRHSDNLVLFHNNIVNAKNLEKSDLLPADIVQCIQTEFSELKNELQLIKEIVLEFLSSNSNCPQSSSVINGQKSYSHGKTADSNDISSEKALLLAQNSCKDISFIDFESKLHDLFETYKKDVILKDIKSEIAINNKEILKEVKSSLQLEIKNITLHIDKSISELKVSDSEFKRELLYLSELVKSNTKKINSLEASPSVEEKLEKHLQSVLNCGSLYGEKKINHKTPPLKQRKKKSKFTMSSNSRCSLHLHSQDKHPSSSKSLSQEPTHDFNLKAGLMKNKEIDVNKVRSIVDEKLKTYNVNPAVERLSTAEFEKKMCLLKTETEMLRNSTECFSAVRDDLDSQIDKIVKSHMKVSHPKKLRFSNSHRQLSPILNKKSEVSTVQNTVSERDTSNCISPLEFAEDYLAQGDFLPLKNKGTESSERKSSPKFAKDAEFGVKSKLKNNDSCVDKIIFKEKSGTTPKDDGNFNRVPNHKYQGAVSFGGSMQNFEDLSELSSLSDLEN